MKTLRTKLCDKSNHKHFYIGFNLQVQIKEFNMSSYTIGSMENSSVISSSISSLIVLLIWNSCLMSNSGLQCWNGFSSVLWATSSFSDLSSESWIGSCFMVSLESNCCMLSYLKVHSQVCQALLIAFLCKKYHMHQGDFQCQSLSET